jgi:outer membrane protein assembly factor BamB
MTGCPTKPPKTPGAPWGADSTWQGAVYTCSVVTTVSKGSIRYIMDWQDATDTGDVSYASEETAAVTHEWASPGTYDVKAKAILDADPAKASDFSPAKSVKVNPNSAPVVDSVLVPPTAVMGAETPIIVIGHDPDGDSLRAIVKWPSGDTTTERTPSPCLFSVSYIFNKVGTADVHVRLQDWKGTRSPDTVIHIPVGKEGGVTWKWLDADSAGGLVTSLLMGNDGTDEVVMGFSSGDVKFYAIKVDKGKVAHSQTTNYPTSEYEFTGHPAFCQATGNVIVGSGEGELYGLSVSNLSVSWRWPGISKESLEQFNEFGSPAINGNDIYVGRDQDADSLYRLYKFTDGGGTITQGPAYIVGTNQSVVDAPAIDADGSVYFGTEGGTLIKIDANLSSPLWTRRLVDTGEIDGPIIGADGTVYCTSESALFAINPDSTNKWTTPVVLDAPASRPALGQTALFIGTDQGTFYSIDPNTGSINWQKTLNPYGFSINTTPIVAANGYVYVMDENDFLYCLNQSDGSQIWSCDCDFWLPGGGRSGSPRPRKLQLVDYTPNPTITSTGNILVPGQGALFCVAGYTDGTLDGVAPWPKWQRDIYNTGKR